MPTLLDRGFSISTLTATGGEGKSYITVQDLALNRLVRWNYHLLTNLPLRVEELSEFVAKQRKCKPEEVADRIHLIPAETLERWAAGDGGPWEYAELLQTKPFDLIIDEAHCFAPRTTEKPAKRNEDGSRPKTQGELWQKFLGEARHPPYALHRIQFLTQSVKKIASQIDTHAKLRYRLEKGDTRRGFLGIPMGDFYQVIASITGTFTPVVYRIEETKDADEKWQRNGEDHFIYRSDIFKLYDTHSDAGGASKASDHEVEPEEYERRPRLLPQKRDYNGDDAEVWTAPTWWWFVTRNVLAFGKVAAVLLIGLILINGGFGYAVGQFTGRVAALAQGFVPGGTKPPTNPRRSKDAQAFTESIDGAVSGDSDCGCPAKRKLIADLANRIRRDREASRGLGGVSAIAPGFVAFRSGDVVRNGQRILSGPYAGETIHEIDFDNRRVRVGDGGWVQLGSGDDEEPGEDNAAVRELLRRAEEAGPSDVDGEGEFRSILVDRDHGTTADANAGDAQPADWPEFRSGGQFGQQDRDGAGRGRDYQRAAQHDQPTHRR